MFLQPQEEIGMTEENKDNKKKARSKYDERKWRDSVNYGGRKQQTDYRKGKKSSTR
jgi:hypothetical protein